MYTIESILTIALTNQVSINLIHCPFVKMLNKKKKTHGSGRCAKPPSQYSFAYCHMCATFAVINQRLFASQPLVVIINIDKPKSLQAKISYSPVWTSQFSCIPRWKQKLFILGKMKWDAIVRQFSPSGYNIKKLFKSYCFPHLHDQQ